MFKIEIKLGNDAMSTPENVADAMELIIYKLRDGETSGTIMDANGNSVGKWEFDPE